MNELIQRLIDKTGIPEDKARTALDVVVNFLKEKLPAPVAAQLDGLMAGGSGMSEKVGEMATGFGAIGGLFGQKQKE
jgi:hypothetical protein